MTYEEYTRNEEAERQRKKGSRILWIVIGSFAALVATCNIIRETKTKNGILTTPEVGDYFVFSFKGHDRPFKLYAIKSDTMEFLIPQYEVSNWKEGDNGSESKARELEQNGKMYDSLFRVRIRKDVVENLHNDPNITLLGEQAQLKTVYGRSRVNF
jgi:hypothetical protein